MTPPTRFEVVMDRIATGLIVIGLVAFAASIVFLAYGLATYETPSSYLLEPGEGCRWGYDLDIDDGVALCRKRGAK